jgi:HKD family nuclease
MTNQGTLNIGLDYHQERQWICSIKQYGIAILNKSLLSQSQKDILIKVVTEPYSPFNDTMGYHQSIAGHKE